MVSARTIGQVAVLLAGPNPRILWPSLGLVAALLVGAVIIAVVSRWRKRSATEGLTAGDQLAHFRRLYELGTITKEEYEAVRTRLASKLRDELNLSAPAADAPPPKAAEGALPPEPPPNGIRQG